MTLQKLLQGQPFWTCHHGNAKATWMSLLALCFGPKITRVTVSLMWEVVWVVWTPVWSHFVGGALCEALGISFYILSQEQLTLEMDSQLLHTNM